MAYAVRHLRNPADPESAYTVWSNGVWEPHGGALPVPMADWTVAVAAGEASRPAPTFFLSPDVIVVSATVIDWDEPSGYVVTQFAGAPKASEQFPIAAFPFAGPHAFGGALGVPAGTIQPTAYPFPTISDAVFNPAGNGQGYLLQSNREVKNFGGASAVPSSAGDGFGIYHRLLMDWPTKQYRIMDIYGAFTAHNGAGQISVAAQPVGKRFAHCKGVRIYDWPNGRGWAEGDDGQLHRCNDAPAVVFGFVGHNITKSGWQDFDILHDGTGAEPVTLAQLHSGGYVHTFVSSTPPTVTIHAPAAAVTDTTRPEIVLVYSDPQGDRPNAFEVAVFTAAQYGIAGFNPETSPATWRTSTTDPAARSFTPNVDLVNGTYRVYARARDRSNLWSSMFAGWASQQWTQNVPALVAPTVNATPGVGLAGVTIDVDGDPELVPIDGLLAVQYRDDGGDPWAWVRDAHELAPDVNGNATTTDHDARFGSERTYRAIAYDPTPWRASIPGATDGATLTDRLWALTSPFDSNIGGVVRVRPGFEWDEPIKSGTFYCAGRTNAVVITDGGPKGDDFTLPVRALNATEREMLEELLALGQVMLLRDPFGGARYVKAIDKVHWTLLRLAPTTGEVTPLRDAHEADIRMIQVDRPHAGPLEGPLLDMLEIA